MIHELDPLPAALDAATLADLAQIESLLAERELYPMSDPDEIALFRTLIQEVRDGTRLRVVKEGSKDVMFLTREEIAELTRALHADPLDEKTRAGFTEVATNRAQRRSGGRKVQ